MKVTFKLAALCALMAFQLARAEEGEAKVKLISTPPGHPDMLCWQADYSKPDEVKDVEITLYYKYWDTKIDGDVPSEKRLGEFIYKGATAQVSFKVALGAKKTQIMVNGLTLTWEGYPLDASFAVAKETARNSDGVYVLAQKPYDPKQPAAIGDTGEADAWIELGIVPKQ